MSHTGRLESENGWDLRFAGSLPVAPGRNKFHLHSLKLFDCFDQPFQGDGRISAKAGMDRGSLDHRVVGRDEPVKALGLPQLSNRAIASTDTRDKGQVRQQL